MIRTAIVAVLGPAEDQASATEIGAVRRLLQTGPYVEVEYLTLAAEQAVLRAKLRILCDGESADLVLTLGGTGLGIKERVPEASSEVLEREVPGFAERIRTVWLARDPEALLFRGVCGVRRRSLILNLPAGAAALALEAVLPGLPLAVAAVTALPRVS